MTAGALARELDRVRAERDAYRDALDELTHDFTARRSGLDVCDACGGLDDYPQHQTAGRVAAGLGLGTPGAPSITCPETHIPEIPCDCGANTTRRHTMTSAGRVAAETGRGSPASHQSARPAECHCRCIHSAVLHDIPRGKTIRTACSFTGPGGPCGCPRYTAGESDG